MAAEGGAEKSPIEAFFAKLEGHVSDDVVTRLQTEARWQQGTSGDRAAAVIDAVLVKQTSISLPDISVLGLVKSLLSASDNNLDTCGVVVSAAAKPLSKVGIFETLLGGTTVIDDPLAELLARYFQAEPLAAMIVVMDSFAIEDQAREIALLVLRVMVREGLGAGADELVPTVKRELSGDERAINNINDKDLEAAAGLVRSLASLCRVARDPADVPRLYNKKYRTMQSITAESADDFASRMTKAGMTKEAALSAYDRAGGINLWNEHLWLALMEARQRNGIPITPPRPVSDDDNAADDGGKARNNLTDIFRLQDEACETCSSVTGLSAYFADLMSLLKSTRCKPDTDNNSNNNADDKTDTDNNSNNNADDKTMLDVLAARRPDLRQLELTCANSMTLIPYISLVNETLESAIRNKLKDLDVFNTPANIDAQDFRCGGDDDGDDAPVYRPGNTDMRVYAGPIAQQMFPFPCFPYNQARDAAAQILGAFGVSTAELTEAFRAPEQILQRVDRSLRGDAEVEERLARGMAAVFARQRAAEALGMPPAEFAAVTGETLFPSWVADLFRGLGAEASIDTGCTWDAATLWGYGDARDMADREKGKGLSFIKRQLMRRAGLEFQDVLDLVGSRCFNQDLVITNRTGSEAFDSAIENLRLLCGASEHPFTALTEDVCFRLQAFLRLRARLKWSTRNLDAAIHCLRTREMEAAGARTGAAPATATALSITPFVVEGLAAIVRLSSLTGVDAMSLLPLWGEMDAYDDASLLYRTFLTPALGQISRTFRRPTDGRVFQTGSNKTLLKSEKMALCTALRWPVELFDTLLGIAGLAKAEGGKPVYLDVDAVSRLYRHVLLCRMLSVAPEDAARFFGLFFGNVSVKTGWRSPLENPMATLAAVEKWKKLLESRWTVKSLSAVVGYGPDENKPKEGSEDEDALASGLKLLSAITQGVKDTRKSLPYLSLESIPSPDNVNDCANRAFDSETAAVIVKFVEGTQVQTETVAFKDKTGLTGLQDLVKESQSWTKKITVSAAYRGNDGPFSAEIELRGLLSAAETEWLKKLTLAANLEDVKKALVRLEAASVRPRALLESRFGCTDPEKQSSPELKALFVAAAEDDGSDRQAQLLARERRRAFIRLAGPTILRDALTSHIMDATKELVPDVEEASIPILLSQMVPRELGGSISAMEALVVLGNELGNRAGPPLTATLGQADEKLNVYMHMLASAAADTFTFSYDGAREASYLPKLSLNGVECQFDTEKSSWKPLSLSPGRVYHLQTDFPASRLRWSTPKSTLATPLPLVEGSDTIQFLPAEKVALASRVARAVKRMGSICKTLRLTPSDIEYVGPRPTTASGFPPIVSVDFNALALEDLVRLHRYGELRDAVNATAGRVAAAPSSASSSEPKGGFPGLLEWLSKNPPVHTDSIEAVAAKIANYTGWNATRVRAALEEKYPRWDGAEVLAALRDLDSLVALRDVMAIDKKLEAAAGARSRPSMAVLFGLALLSMTPFSPALGDMQLARDLQARLTPAQRARADEALAENMRRALVEYLLQQKYVADDLGIRDADGLFEHFLIDVQMGPQLRTTRIKLAISVVQLFVQRCLLGLENEVGKGSLAREDWEWRQQYSLWEVHRKLFLYPENWVDPTLRDTKSQLFERLEASLMHKDLSAATFTQALKTYVYGLNDIARLDVVAYLHDGSGRDDTYHLFARTRAAPYKYYHRSLLVAAPDEAGGGVFWRPWTSIEMDIAPPETDPDGNGLEQRGAHLIPVLAGNRLYLFLPQLAPKTLADTSQLKGDDSFRGLADKKVDSAKPKRFWELSMAWTELADGGKWLPKRVSAGHLTVDATTAPRELQFDPFISGAAGDTAVTLVASTRIGSDSVVSRRTYGAFVFCEDQISVLTPAALDVEKYISLTPLHRPVPFQPWFQTVAATTAGSGGPFVDKTVSDTPVDGNGPKPLIWLPKGLEKTAPTAQSLSWTLSHTAESISEGRTTPRLVGLAVSLQWSDGTNTSYFSVPRSRFKPTTTWNRKKLDEKMDLAGLDHRFSGGLVQAAASRAEPLKQLFDYLSGPEPAKVTRDSFGKISSDPPAYHELARPTALYDWELGLHAVLLAVDRFMATQQFDEAVAAARLVFDPTIDSGPAHSCWRFPPFRQLAAQIAKDGREGAVDLQRLGGEIHRAILERRSAGTLVHAAARSRPQAYMKWVVMKYAEALIASGDVYFRRGTMESLPLATQRYIEAVHVLGPEPPRVPARLAKRKAKVLTFGELADLQGSEVQNQLGLPFSAELVGRGDGSQRRKTSYITSPYFCVPINPKFKELRGLVNRRLHNLRNSLSIDGKPVRYSLIEPPIDPGALLALSAGGASMADALAMMAAGGGLPGPLPRQRFDVLLRRALELCSELRVLGERLVTAIERKEGEAFAALQARHATAIGGMIVGMRKLQLDEANQAVESLLLRRAAHASQLGYYLALIGEPASRIPTPTGAWTDIEQNISAPSRDDLRLSPYESMEMRRAEAAAALSMVAAGMDQLVVPLCLMPNIDTNIQPMGMGVSVGIGGNNFSSALQASAAVVRNSAAALAEEGGRMARKAALTVQLQERRRQANALGHEIKVVDKEVEIQRLRIREAQQDMDMEQANLENARQVEAWLRTKYTSEQLYGWMEKTLRSLHASAYEVAVAAAQRAEAALTFEQGRNVQLLRRGANNSGYWQGLGLLAADYLYQDLKRLEALSLESPPHDFEITKAVSLRQVNPRALLQLRLTGSATFSLSELLFDIDFPGHYMRRIRSVAVSIPAVLGPHTGVNATLTLLSHRYRVSAAASTGAEYTAATADRSSFRTDNVPMTAVAVSGGAYDAGVFELAFGGPRFLPFEGAGAVSTWRLELPPTSVRRFDYETISDVVLHLQYTASDGGACLRAAATEAVDAAAHAAETQGRGDGFWALWDLRNDFPGAWYNFSSQVRAARGGAAGGAGGKGGAGEGEKKADQPAAATPRLLLGNLKEQLPFWSRRQNKLQVCAISLVSRSKKFVEGVEVVGADDRLLPQGITPQDEKLGDSSLRTWLGLNVESLDGWVVRPKAAEQLLGEKETALENVYMLVRYVFKA